MRYLITKEIARQARANGWNLTVGMSNEYDHKGRQKQSGTLVAYHAAADIEFSGSNEVFIDCFVPYPVGLSDVQFNEKYYGVK